jgi:hypothetical protein
MRSSLRMIAAAVVMMSATSSFAALAQFNPGPYSQVQSGAITSALVLGGTVNGVAQPVVIGQPTSGDSSGQASLDVTTGGVVIADYNNFTYYLPNGDGTYTPETGLVAINDAIANLAPNGVSSLSNGQPGYTQGNGGANTGIFSSSTANPGSPGYVGWQLASTEQNNGYYTYWRGININNLGPNSVMIGYAQPGDIDLIGALTQTDFTQLNGEYNSRNTYTPSIFPSTTTWADGDFDYGGSGIYQTYFTEANGNYNARASQGPAFNTQESGVPVSAPSLTASAVPEPATIATLIVAACGFALRCLAIRIRSQL